MGSAISSSEEQPSLPRNAARCGGGNQIQRELENLRRLHVYVNELITNRNVVKPDICYADDPDGYQEWESYWQNIKNENETHYEQLGLIKQIIENAIIELESGLAGYWTQGSRLLGKTQILGRSPGGLPTVMNITSARSPSRRLHRLQPGEPIPRPLTTIIQIYEQLLNNQRAAATSDALMGWGCGGRQLSEDTLRLIKEFLDRYLTEDARPLQSPESRRRIGYGYNDTTKKRRRKRRSPSRNRRKRSSSRRRR